MRQDFVEFGPPHVKVDVIPRQNAQGKSRSGSVSYLDTTNAQLEWLPVTAQTSVRLAAGCVQCGSQLNSSDLGSTLTGKCLSCENWISDEEDSFEELED